MTTPEERSLAAEVRAVEEGHHAFLDRDENGPYIWVVSDTYLGKSYRVTATSLGPGEPITFTCVPRRLHAFKDDHLHLTGAAGMLPCKHAGVAARRLERTGYARWDGGMWYATDKAIDFIWITHNSPEDPFEGL